MRSSKTFMIGSTNAFCRPRMPTVLNFMPAAARLMTMPQSVAFIWKRQTYPCVSPSVIAFAALDTISTTLFWITIGREDIPSGVPQ